jgi:hypothetical protein
MNRVFVFVVVLGIVSVAGAAQAQEELKKVAKWNGEWAVEVSGRDNKGGEQWTAKMKGKQHQVGDFCVWDATWTAHDGKEMSSLGITGYDPAKKEYFGVGFRSDGYWETSVVTFSNGTATYDVTGTTAAREKVRTRCTWPHPPKDKYEGKCETLTDGEWWVSWTEKGVRVK